MLIQLSTLNVGDIITISPDKYIQSNYTITAKTDCTVTLDNTFTIPNTFRVAMDCVKYNKEEDEL